mgnify:FL=1
MAVAYDADAQASGAGVSSRTTAEFTISGSDRVGLLGLGFSGAAISARSGSIGGTTGAEVTSTYTDNTFAGSTIFRVTAPPSGAQTGTMAWTTAVDAVLGAITFTGVHQTTPTNGGTAITDFATSASRTVTTTSGDMSFSAGMHDTVSGVPTHTRTLQWNTLLTGAIYGFGATGPGNTSSDIHTYEGAGSDNVSVSGCNLVQAAATTESGGLFW